jgi:CDP-diacylglycerol--serine O-phosphatidyltransferase
MGTKDACYQVEQQAISILHSAKAYQESLLELINNANERIYITALYLQDDEAGNKILDAIHQRAIANPTLDVKIFVDFHRGQRGLIGEKESLGNAAFYQRMRQQYNSQVAVYGVPVKGKELFGVLHLKGLVVDDMLLYTGASINNVYLQHDDRYRLDRYFLVDNKAVADAFVDFMCQYFLASEAVVRLDELPIKRVADNKPALKQFIQKLKKASYAQCKQDAEKGEIELSLFAGFGRRGNKLNKVIKDLFNSAQHELVLYTPYFNFPAPLVRLLRKKLKQGVNVTIVVGDKTANDFYISPDKPFSKIGALPYLYETILTKFVQSKADFIKSGQLNVHLWKHEDNTFHLKGINVDGKRFMMTGHNLNPRAWGLDLENGILFDDPKGLLTEQINQEKAAILANTVKINSVDDLQTLNDYPEPVKKLLGQAKRVKVDFIIKKFI